ncbi:TRAP transporter small permease subunit [Leucobacter sp. gxy201]|uniref:TRAP transporter small permease n=1 Tax=Leucobacter sp. gxy201 TaxID=2957200 RepID=UPI003DA12480
MNERPPEPSATPRPVSPLARVGRAIGAIEMTFGIVTLTAILILIFLQALQRYLPMEQLAWTGEISRFSLTWLTFAAAGLLVTSRGHISLEILDSLKSPLAVRIVHVISYLALAAIGAGLAYAAWILADSQGIVKSPVLKVPMSYVYIPVLLGLVSMTVRSLIMAFDVLKNGPALNEIEDDEVEVVA